ncbi:hypothetical protein EVAR_77089_1 [Eumeta japonica]|uniref:Uncharacterized protein n=1 Tax=Eumeta variegata TaxID=151549 RepID=A0A4C1T2E4_EUMVA|nr:hypothetical protein EVAR_77089_1 [Eumeta japonica]
MTALVTCRFVGSDVSNTSVGVFRRPRLKPRASLLMSHCRPRVFHSCVAPELYIVVISRVGHFIQDFNLLLAQPRNSKAAFDESHKLVSKHAWLPLYLLKLFKKSST